ncbi:MAG TPA: alginate lyase family protein, partial [Acidimicrobiales bacterium]|nr:alginate lyase family protein [Acidimicrobiales bacterium]
QILPDGAHEERSISYHALVLQDVLETWRLSKSAGLTKAEEIGSHLQPMCRFLEGMASPGNTWPMLNDTVPGYPCDPRQLLAEAAAEPELGTSPPAGRRSTASRVFASAGYAVIADPAGRWAVLDAGPMGPDRVLGHGHADALSVEIHHGDRPLVVDPGVFTYRAGGWRDRFRGTAAHNTAVVDGQDQCVFWGPFRVAYPPRARLLDWSRTHARGEHHGYSRLPGGVVHTRRLELLEEGAWRVDDRFDGHGQHDLSIGFQLAAGARLQVTGTSGRAVWPDGRRLDIIALSAPAGAVAAAEDGWISADWNVKQAAPRFVLGCRGAVPLDCALILRTVRGGEDRA